MLITKLLKLWSLFRDWNQHFLNFNPFFETGIETFKMPIPFLRLGSRLTNGGGSLWSRLSGGSRAHLCNPPSCPPWIEAEQPGTGIPVFLEHKVPFPKREIKPVPVFRFPAGNSCCRSTSSTSTSESSESLLPSCRSITTIWNMNLPLKQRCTSSAANGLGQLTTGQ